MYGKLSAALVTVAYFIPLVSFIFRQQISMLSIKLMLKIGYIKIDDMPVPANITTTVFIYSLVVSVICAVAAIILGHYSKYISEDHGSWLNFVIGLGYIYFSLVILVFFAVKNFSMSGYR